MRGQAVVTRLLAAFFALAVGATSAEGAVVKMFPFDSCWIDTSADLNVWSAIDGTPTISTTVDSTPGNRCSLQLNPASGATEYVAASIAATGTTYAGLRLYAATVPTVPRRIGAFRATGSGKTGAILYQEPDGTCPTNSSGAVLAGCTKYQLRIYYGSAYIDTAGNQSGGECSSSQIDGTPCGSTCTTLADCLDTTRTDTQCSKICQGGAFTGRTCTANSQCTGGVCSASKYCLAECPEGHPGEAACTRTAVGTTITPLVTNTWYLVGIGQVNGTGTVTVSLTAGAAGANPTAQQLASYTTQRGICSGGPRDRYICATNADCKACEAGDNDHSVCASNADCANGTCDATGTCDTSSVIQPDQVRFGFDVAELGAGDLRVDEIVIDNASPTLNYRMNTLAPDGQSVAGNWASVGTAHSCGSGTEWACLNDGTSPDGNTSAIGNSQAAQPTMAVRFASPSTPVPTPIMAVAVNAVAQDSATGTNGITVDLELTDVTGAQTGTTSVYTPFAFDTGFSGTGSTSDAYHQMPTLLSTTAPDGSTWDATDLNDVELRIEKTAGGGDSGRISTTSLTVLSRMPDPPVPDTMIDRTGNGRITVCLLGGSGWNDPPLHQAVAAGLAQADDVIEEARGGYTVDDVVAELSIPGTNNDLLDGTGSAFVKGTTGGGNDVHVLKGVTAPCDYVMVEIGVNSWTGGGYSADSSNRKRVCVGGSNAGATCAADSACPSGVCALGWAGTAQGAYCDDNGGADDGGSCYAPQHSTAYSDLTASECVGGTTHGARCSTTGAPNFPVCGGGGVCTRVRKNYCRTRSIDFGKECFNTYDCYCTADSECKIRASDANGVCSRVCVSGGSPYIGKTCSANADCGEGLCRPEKICQGGPDNGLNKSCATSADCRGLCSGGTNAGAACTVDSACPGGSCARFLISCINAKSCVTEGNFLMLTGECDVSKAQPATWCSSGTKGAPGCRNGLCIGGNSEARLRDQFRRMEDIVAARHYCRGGTNAAAICTAASECPGGGTCDGTPKLIISAASPGRVQGGSFCWWSLENKAGAHRAWLLPWLSAQGHSWLNTYSRLWFNCPELYTRGDLLDPHDCLRDQIHWSEDGQNIVAQNIVDCLTQASGEQDGVCTPGTCTASACTAGPRATLACATNADCSYCTAGRVNDLCATNADCSFYSCSGLKVLP